MGTLAGYFLVRQDLPVIMLAAAAFLLLKSSDAALPTLSISTRQMAVFVGLGAVAIIFGGWIGSNVIMHGRSLTRDEQMAVQDATIFASGRFMAPLPAEWRELSGALARDFNSITFRPEMTVSGYRPGNAFAHAMMNQVGLMHFTAPLFAAVGLIATWRVANRLWPTETMLHWLAAVFYLCSAQMWAASMTTYAMSMLLGLNMAWLALFLRHDRFGYVGAIIIGFIATGAHQVPYHLMFAAPFIGVALMERRWRIVVTFGLLYAAFALFWFRYEDFVSFMMGGDVLKTASQSLGNTIGGYIPDNRVTGNAAFTAANIVRLLSWQHILILPLVIIAVRAAIRDRNWLLLAMICACMLPLAVKFLQIAFQVHGWGYRYMHGFLGLLCLLAVAGWRELQKTGQANLRHLHIGTALTLIVVAPWHFWNIRQFSGAYAQVDQKLAKIDSDIVVVDTGAASFGGDLVVNHPDLTNRPIRLAASGIRDRDVPLLCKMGSVTIPSSDTMAPIQQFFGTPVIATDDYKAVANRFRETCPTAVR